MSHLVCPGAQIVGQQAIQDYKTAFPLIPNKNSLKLWMYFKSYQT